MHYGCMDAIARELRWRRRSYARAARRHRLLRGLPFYSSMVGPPFGRHLERHENWYWRVRLPLWVALGAVGWLVLGWVGVVPGLTAAILFEFVVSYRLVRGIELEPGPGGPAGVREPRRPGKVGRQPARVVHAAPGDDDAHDG